MATALSPSVFVGKSIKFGTDGWRGMIAADFTFERVELVAALSAKVLEECYGSNGSRTVIVGYDRRFLSPEFAGHAAEAIAQAGYEVLLSECFAPTPAFSWAAHEKEALGAIVITASHNPAAYSGLKVKGAFGGSVPPDVTKKVEALLPQGKPVAEKPGTITSFDPWPSYCQALQGMVDIEAIRTAIANSELTVFADVMHGSAAGGFEKVLGMPINEINGDADPLFEGGAPEPLPRYIPKLYKAIKERYQSGPDGLTVGIIFDGDSDRVAGMDGQGEFLSSQVLIPILIDHLKAQRGFDGEVIKTISGSNLMQKVAEMHGLAVHETPIGYKYIADRMLETQVLIGGEESGGIGYGHHIPERDALLSALYLLEAVVKSGKDFGQLNQSLRQQTDFSGAYDRIDLPLANMEVRAKLLDQLQNATPTEVAGKGVEDVLSIDGYKFTLADGSWLLIRFSGTEPVLRLYSEGATIEDVHKHLNWAKDWANSVG
ncbi:MAG: phosphoglucomutase/phosphomannomutase family protein [Cyanobacteria bacterium P01_D01_bin.56]